MGGVLPLLLAVLHEQPGHLGLLLLLFGYLPGIGSPLFFLKATVRLIFLLFSGGFFPPGSSPPIFFLLGVLGGPAFVALLGHGLYK